MDRVIRFAVRSVRGVGLFVLAWGSATAVLAAEPAAAPKAGAGKTPTPQSVALQRLLESGERHFVAPPDRTALQAAIAEEKEGRAYRLEFEYWNDGWATLDPDVEVKIGGKESPVAGQPAFLFHLPGYGDFSVWIAGWGDAIALVGRMPVDLPSEPLRMTGLEEVKNGGAEIHLYDGSGYTVRQEDQAKAAALAVGNGVWVISDKQVVIFGAPDGRGPLLEVTRIGK